MNPRTLLALSLGIAPLANGQDAQDAPAAADVQKQLREMQDSLRAIQDRHQAELDALKEQIAAQQKLIDALQKNPTAPAPAAPVAGGAPAAGAASLPFPTEDPSVAPTPAAGAMPTNDPSVVPGTPAGATGPSPSLLPNITMPAAPQGSYLNVSFDAMIIGAASSGDLSQLEVGHHDPQQNGFNARNFELSLSGAVDPYFEGFANIVYTLDNEGESELEIEEAFGQTTSLPHGLQLKGGQFFSPFGRINSAHPHSWDFVDAPLVHGRLLGPDGLRGIGAQLSWVLPTPFYAQAMVALQNGQGETAYSFRNPGEDGTFFGRPTMGRTTDGLSDMVVTPRLETSFDLSPTQTLLAGISGAFGPNDTGADTNTQIYGVDLFYKWKPADAAGGFPFVKWQSEAMLRRFEAGQGLEDAFPQAEVFNDWGAYSQVVWGFRKGWAVGLRGDYLHMEDSEVTEDPQRQSRVRLSSELTWFPSEFSKLRLQFNHDILRASESLPKATENSLFLLYEISLGAHGAHKY